MSNKADIDNLFEDAIAGGDMGSERDLLSLKLEIYGSLDWCSAEEDTVRIMKEKGYPVPSWAE